jgi:hypothetical protein
MSLQNNHQSFSPQDDASLRPTQGALLPTSFSPGAQPASHPSNDVQNLLYTHPMPIPWQTFQNDQTWLPGQPIGPTLMMQDWALNPDIRVTPLYTPSWSNPGATQGNHHSAGVPLGMRMVKHR